jgi:hypothetical protein
MAWVSVPPLLTFLLMIVVGWVHRRQLIVIEYLQAENRLRRARLSGKRIRFTDGERALLARKANTVSNVFMRNGIEPAPERSKRTTWSTFLRAHWTALNPNIRNEALRKHPELVQ